MSTATEAGAIGDDAVIAVAVPVEPIQLANVNPLVTSSTDNEITIHFKNIQFNVKVPSHVVSIRELKELVLSQSRPFTMDLVVAGVNRLELINDSRLNPPSTSNQTATTTAPGSMQFTVIDNPNVISSVTLPDDTHIYQLGLSQQGVQLIAKISSTDFTPVLTSDPLSIDENQEISNANANGSTNNDTCLQACCNFWDGFCWNSCYCYAVVCPDGSNNDRDNDLCTLCMDCSLKSCMTCLETTIKVCESCDMCGKYVEMALHSLISCLCQCEKCPCCVCCRSLLTLDTYCKCCDACSPCVNCVCSTLDPYIECCCKCCKC
jgi:hypothetical protein